MTQVQLIKTHLWENADFTKVILENLKQEFPFCKLNSREPRTQQPYLFKNWLSAQ